MSEIIFTRDEAIVHVVRALTRHNIDRGAELAAILGDEIAAGMVFTAIDIDSAALDALGVTEEDVRRVAADLEAQKQAETAQA